MSLLLIGTGGMKGGSEYRLAPPLTVAKEPSMAGDGVPREHNYELITPTQSNDTPILPEVRVRHAQTWSADMESNEDLRLRNRVETL
jgi:hypothetical protein